ncbi:Holliday junction resolvase RuvX [Hydrogenophilus thiooxidans]|uniref:Holliday junction resolvase RuvX n=1 Tax=Hydrogenophilus thiooxidans TaxID=2820326 RepID=UPI001C232F81|nr:Holliday junction resolvase RuvX [Hydrogenophilus thiooxidans]
MAERARAPSVGVWLGIDYGNARIGVAVATLPVAIATPLTTLAAQPEGRFWDAFDAFVAEWQPKGFVVGWPPAPATGDPHPMHPAITAFANTLTARYAKPIYWVDESLTSAHAEQLLRETGKRRWQARKARLDAVAAALILQTFCDGHATVHPSGALAHAYGTPYDTATP